MAEQARQSAVSVAVDAAPVSGTAETVADLPGGAARPVTEGIIKAEGLTWFQIVVALMKVIMPWKGRLAATFVFGVLRVLAFIRVGVLSALVVLALNNGHPYDNWLSAIAVAARPPGVLPWPETRL